MQSADPEGWVRIPEVDLWLGIWQDERLGHPINWLRWWDASGNLLLWSAEQAEQDRQRAELEHQRAEQEHQRSQASAAKLRELDVDPDPDCISEGENVDEALANIQEAIALSLNPVEE